MKGKQLVRSLGRHIEQSKYDEASGLYDQRQTGIYILYNGEIPYYVDKSDRTIRGRIRRHRIDRHAGKWDNFSFYVVEDGQSDNVEALLLDYYRPEGNRIGRRFKPLVQRS